MEVSARPENLKKFVTEGRDATRQLKSDLADAQQAYTTFVNAPNHYPVTNASLAGEGGGLDALGATWTADENFVEMVEHAFEDADDAAGPGIVTADAADIEAAVERVARDRGLLPVLASDRPPITITDPQITPVPRTSGFVNDPVCTATGHFVEVELDLVWPPRLAALAWRRVYSSQPGRAGPHGRGWAAWPAAGLHRHADGRAAFHGADGQVVHFVPAGDGTGGWLRSPWIAATLQPAADGGAVLAWDWSSDHPGQRWAFDAAGRLVTVEGHDTGTTRFGYADDRLIEVRHDSGRHLRVVWVDDRVTALHSSCGREVRYHYDERGDLVQVDRPLGVVRYRPDEHGRIVEVHDADGVRLCHNTFDDEGRVQRQVSPFGAETELAYRPGLVTAVGEAGGPTTSVWQHDAVGRLVSLTNGHGHRLARRFDDQGRCVSVTDFDGYQVANEFDDEGRVLQARTSEGAVQRFERDELDRVVRYERADGSWFALEYRDDSPFPARLSAPEGWEVSLDVRDGLVHSLTDADGVRVSAEYDADGNVVALEDGLGHRTTIRPHVTGAPTEITLPDGARFGFEHDGAGRLLALHAPTGQTWRLDWTPGGRPARITDPDGRTALAIQYGSHGAEEDLVDALGRRFHLEHDTWERVRTLVTPDGRKWDFGYDVMGLVTSVNDPAGAAWLLDHDRRGRLTSRTDPNGHVTRYRYDPIGRLAEVTDPTGATTRSVRDAVGRVEALIDAEGGVTTYGYDGCGRLVAADDADLVGLRRRYSRAGRLLEVRTTEGRGEVFEYDAAGRLVASTDATGARTTLAYDPCGRLVEIVRPSGRPRRFQRDLLGRVVALDDGGFGWRFTYDHDGRVTSRTDPLGATTRFRYDGAGNLVTAIDPLGGVTTLEWDERNVCTRVTDALGLSVTTRYDERRRPLAFTDQLGRTTSLRRDAAGRIVGRDLPTGQRVEYRLDARGRVTDTRVDGRDVIVRQLDRCGRPVVVHEPGPNRTHLLSWSRGGRLRALDSGDGELRWDLDGDGLVVGRHGGGHAVRYHRDRAGRLSGQQGDGYGGLRLHRDEDGRLVAIVGAGLERRFAYDDAGHLVRRLERVGPHLTVTTLERDGAGRVVATRTGDDHRTYAYDAAGQLVAAHGPDGHWSFTYDAAGRLVHEAGPHGRRAFLYDDAHQLVRIESAQGVVSYRYDEVGQRTSERGDDGVESRYHWDGLGRLVGFERSGQRHVLDVDAFGSLVAVDHTRLRWDPTTDVPELVAVGERAVVVCDHLVLGESDHTDVHWWATDWRGTPGASDAGDPWGAAPASGAGPRVGFAGEVTVAGRVWLRNRPYDPGTRQFLSQDPRPGRPGNPWAANPYHYAGNDPIGHVDPLGLAPVSFEDYDRYRQADTGWQWGHIALVGAAVGMAVLAASGVGLPVLLAAGFAAGALPELIDQAENGMGFDPARILKAGAFGALGAGVGAGVGSVMAGTTRPLWQVMAVEGAGAGAPSAAEEAYDVIPGAPGADGSFDMENIVINTVAGGTSPVIRRLRTGAPDTPPTGGNPTPAGNTDPAPAPHPNGPDPDAGPPPSGRPPTPPAAPEPVGGRPPFTNTERSNALNDRVSQVQAGPNTDITTGSRQVDASGNPVGLNRPHLQYTDAGGQRHVEFFTEPGQPASSLADRVARVQAQDPNAIIEVHEVPRGAAPVPAGGP